MDEDIQYLYVRKAKFNSLTKEFEVKKEKLLEHLFNTRQEISKCKHLETKFPEGVSVKSRLAEWDRVLAKGLEILDYINEQIDINCKYVSEIDETVDEIQRVMRETESSSEMYVERIS